MNKLKYLVLFFALLFFSESCTKPSEELTQSAQKVLAKNIIDKAEWALTQMPVTVTDFVCDRSAGSMNEFYSEGDYWWPDPQNPDAPYIRRDGETNPENFVAHRHAMVRLSLIVGYLTSAYLVTDNVKYAQHAIVHLNAWFVDPATMMSPHLLYAQAIKGRATGRGIGIIDTIHLMEVAQSVIHLTKSDSVNHVQLRSVTYWFEKYLDWLTSHPYGIAERDAKNNHGTCWVMQVASFSKLTGNEELMDYCRNRYKTVLIPDQMGEDGSFPFETARTKPYGYSLFNLDAMATICQILSNEEDNLWEFTTESGLGIRQGIQFLVPYIEEKDSWPYDQDIMYWDEWPVAHPFLIFSAVEFDDVHLFDLWKQLEHFPDNDEVVRNLPVRNPLIWIL